MIVLSNKNMHTYQAIQICMNNGTLHALKHALKLLWVTGELGVAFPGVGQERCGLHPV
jgi:hypothetical protein